ncbi:hypothetical protein D3C76_1628170 [compost metagenome]
MQPHGLEGLVHLAGAGGRHRDVGVVVRQQPHHHRAEAATEQVEAGEEQRHGGRPQARFHHVLDGGVDAGVEVVGEQPAQAEHADEEADLDAAGEQCVAGAERGHEHAEGGQ